MTGDQELTMNRGADNAPDDRDERYERLRAEFEAFRAEAEGKLRAAAVSAAYRALLHDSGLTGRRAESVLRVTDLSGMELDDTGRLKDEAALRADIAAQWSDLVGATAERAAPVATPPEAGMGPGDAFVRGFDA